MIGGKGRYFESPIEEHVILLGEHAIDQFSFIFTMIMRLKKF